jgi:type III secretion system FlhB-like substrate exporter
MGKRNRRNAAAISYRPEDGAPRVIASGLDRDAERIIEAAREAGIAIVEDAPLAALLQAAVRPGDPIPPRCWEAVASILAFVFKQGASKRHFKDNKEGKQ